jgi:3-mercaptopyruvate sulfurtransferase SseA
MKELDIRSEDELFLYDDFTVVGACRGYWMFKTYGKLGWIMNGTHADLAGSGLELESGEMNYLRRMD